MNDQYVPNRLTDAELKQSFRVFKMAPHCITERELDSLLELLRHLLYYLNALGHENLITYFRDDVRKLEAIKFAVVAGELSLPKLSTAPDHPAEDEWIKFMRALLR